MKLYRLLSEQEVKLNGDLESYKAVSELAVVAFSLWRAVFLSDTTGEFADKAADLRKFLVSLISDNTVVYSTDKNARNWSFRYYVDYAMSKLTELSNISRLVEIDVLIRVHADDKEEWSHLQEMLEIAIERLEINLMAAGP